MRVHRNKVGRNSKPYRLKRESQQPVRHVRFPVAVCTRCGATLGPDQYRNVDGVCGPCLIPDARRTAEVRTAEVAEYLQNAEQSTFHKHKSS